MRSAPADPGTRVLVHGDRRLRRRARPVAAGEDLGDLPARLASVMAEAGGIGLAAPQLGDPRRVIAVREPGADDARVLVDPEVVARRGPLVWFEEGCLSFPGLFFRLLRPRCVEVRYREPGGRPRTLVDDGVLARVVQHEIDHLDGVLFIDHLPRWRRWLLAPRLATLRGRARRAARDAAAGRIPA